jgi:hypothetical protein
MKLNSFGLPVIKCEQDKYDVRLCHCECNMRMAEQGEDIENESESGK